METCPLKLKTLNKKDFKKVLKEGKSFRKDFLVLKVRPNLSEKVRFGVLVSKKLSKKAVLRNKIKRRLREITRANLEKLVGLDLVFIPFPQIFNCDFWEIKQMAEKIFEKIKKPKNEFSF